MLLSFKIENFRSVKDQVIIDFTETARLDESHLPNNTFESNGDTILNSLIIYGRNASGKSNVIMALQALTYLIDNSDSFQSGKKIPPYEPFKFEKKAVTLPIKFEVEFIGIESKQKYQYTVHYTSHSITYESLRFYPQGISAKLFERKESEITYGEYYKGAKKKIGSDLLGNQLFLSKASTSNVSYLDEVYKYFTQFFYVSTVHDTEYDKTLIRAFSEVMLDDERMKSNVRKLLKAADTNISDFSINKVDPSKFKFPENIPEEIQEDIIERYKYKVNASHLMFDDGELVGLESLDLEEESFGTKKLLTIGALIIDTLDDGGVIVIDELDKGLHPLLTRMLIKLFHSKKNNPNNAQLIFATHDSTLLDTELFRRDQMCFVDKEYEGGSVFYKLSDIKGVRKDVPIDKWYLSGRYKAIPVISDLTLEF